MAKNQVNTVEFSFLYKIAIVNFLNTYKHIPTFILCRNAGF